ncbi:MAG TPA: FHA domain-containing protein [Polyangiaceae bacterium]|nr:FHA domain-containing protein [Polyangiaceae bacterium]
MITCPKCGKENQDHYKFCLGCGAELPRGGGAAKPFTSNTPPHGIPALGGQRPSGASPAGAPAAGAQPLAGTAVIPPRPSQQPQADVRATAPATPQAHGSAQVTCPQCGHGNVPGNRFCASCGYNLSALSGAQAMPAAAATSAAASGGARSIMLTALRADGTEAGNFRLPDGPTVTVGRDTGSIFAGDSYLSPRHATFSRRGAQLSIRDEGSLNGVYLKLKPQEPNRLEYGDVFRIGQEIIRFEELRSQGPSTDGVERFGSPGKGYIGRLALVIGRDTTGNAFPIPERGIHCGRERGDILFSEDGYVSGLHCQVSRGADGQVYLTDLGSSNGSFIRLRAERNIAPGDILLMGQQLFRIDL